MNQPAPTCHHASSNPLGSGRVASALERAFVAALSACPGAMVSPRGIACLMAILMIFTGCVLPEHSPRLLAPAYRPQNVFLWGSSLPPQIRRVALLPMACDQDVPEMVDGRDVLEPIVQCELAKFRRFELIPLSSELLRTQTGQATWSCEEALPQDLFSWLSDTRGCDAVLFCRLTVFRGYAPLAVGWRMRLVDVRTRSTLWAGDEVFDAGRPSVQAGARHYQLAVRPNCAPIPDEWVIENSPRQFGQYAAAQLLATLPGL
jgi:hypothetical protein